MPDSVLMPAPVNATMLAGLGDQAQASRSVV